MVLDYTICGSKKRKNIKANGQSNMISLANWPETPTPTPSRALSRPVRPRRGEDDNGRDSLVFGRGGRPSTAVDYRHAKILNETNTSTQIS